MPQPPAYNRTKDFTENFGTETDHASVNAELDKVSNSINDMRDNLAVLQADDGKLRPEVVTPESVAPALFALIVDEVKADAAQLLADANAASANAIAQAETAATAATSATASKNAAATSEANAALYAGQAQAAIGQPADNSVTDAKIAVGSKLKNRIDDVVSVKDSGAKGDGAADDTAAVVAAAAKLGAAPGRIVFPAGTYKLTGTVSLRAGQSIDFRDAVLDVTGLDAPLFSYNVAGNPFTFANQYPPTEIIGGKVLGAGSGWAAGNANFVLVRANRTPYIHVKNCTLYRAAVAELIGESFFCSFENVVVYEPISNCWRLTMGAGDFGPNYTNFINCEVEEQKQVVTAIYVEAGTVCINGGLFESVTKAVHAKGASVGVKIIGAGLPQRYQEDGVSVHIEQAYEVTIDQCNCTFGGRVPSGPAINTAFLKIDSNLALCNVTDNTFVITHDDTDSSRLFSINAFVTATIKGNRIQKSAAGSNASVFAVGNNAGYQITGIFAENELQGVFGASMKFFENSASAGSNNMLITNNRFLRVVGFTNNAGNVFDGNHFLGGAGSISFLAADKGALRGNSFSAPGWTLSNYLFLENNAGLFGNGYAPQIQSNSVSSGTIGAGSHANVVVPVPIAFSDAAYVPVATVVEGTYGNSTLTVDHICQQSATQVTVVLKNNSGSAASGTVNVMFIHS